MNEAFLDTMRSLLGDTYAAFEAAMRMPPAGRAISLNPRRGFETALSRVPWEPMGRYIDNNEKLGSGLYHFCGAFYMQEASAMLPARMLAVQPGELALDLCAAPGGKAFQIARDLNGRGAIVANDAVNKRARVLASNLERMGVTNAVVVNAMPDVLARRLGCVFDAVLIDAPCSGEGMFRREPAALNEWNAGLPKQCAARQLNILESAVSLVKPGGRLVYSTCTFNETENERVVHEALRRFPELALVEMRRIMPHEARGEGQFAALFTKSGDLCPRKAAGACTPEARELIARFESIASVPSLGEYVAHVAGDRLALTPAIVPALDGLNVVNGGLSVLRAGRSHVQPEHAYVMAFPELFKRRVDLSTPEALMFAAGSDLFKTDAGFEGHAAAMWRDMPLGVAKISGETLKNHLPKGLRRALSGE